MQYKNFIILNVPDNELIVHRSGIEKRKDIRLISKQRRKTKKRKIQKKSFNVKDFIYEYICEM